MTDTFERTQLDGKDRGQLSEIAAALGVKAVSRMRKADLVDAIVAATAGSGSANGSSAPPAAPIASSGSFAPETARPRRIRSTVSGGDDLASLAEEQNTLAGASEPVDEMAMIRRRPAASPDQGNDNGNGNGAVSSAPTSTERVEPDAHSRSLAPAVDDDYSTSGDDAHGDDAGDDASGDGGHSSQQSQSRDDDGQGNRSRRRRRRGRDRDRPGVAGATPSAPSRARCAKTSAAT